MVGWTGGELGRGWRCRWVVIECEDGWLRRGGGGLLGWKGREGTGWAGKDWLLEQGYVVDPVREGVRGKVTTNEAQTEPLLVVASASTFVLGRGNPTSSVGW